MRKYLVVLSVFMLATALPSLAQKLSISANLLDYACLGTLNMDVSYSVSRRWSVVAGARYNPFTFNAGDPDEQFQYRQQSYAVGARMWPWHTMSGWWIAGKVRYQEYCYGGIFSDEAEEGDRFGAGLYAGYTYMLSPHWNLEFGVGMWGGRSWYKTYSCPACGITVDSGATWFARPDDVMMSFVYVF
jgi:hypothetical protein